MKKEDSSRVHCVRFNEISSTASKLDRQKISKTSELPLIVRNKSFIGRSKKKKLDPQKRSALLKRITSMKKREKLIENSYTENSQRFTDVVEVAVLDDYKRNAVRKKACRLVSAIARAGLFSKFIAQGAVGNVAFLNASQSGAQSQSFWGIDRRSSDASQTQDVALPTATDLSHLPINLKATFCDLASATLRKFLYPRSLLWLQRRETKKLLEHGRDVCPEMTVELLRKQPMFKKWPQNILEDVIRVLELSSYEAGQFIIHEDEASGSGIFFIMCGNVKVVKKRSWQVKSISDDNTATLATLGPVVCVGEFSFLTEEPRMASIKAVTRVHCLVLRKQDFATFVKYLPEHTFSQIIETAFETRNKNMHLAHPITENHLNTCSIFRPCPSAMLKQLISKLFPCAMPKDATVCKLGEPADRMFFLRNGSCGVFRNIKGKEIHVITIKSKDVLCDVPVLHGGTYPDTYKTLKTCDFWVLTKTSFDQVLQSNLSVVHLMMREARELRQHQLSRQRNLYKRSVAFIPLLKNLCSESQIKELVKEFSARVYKPLSVIISPANCADRIIILYNGHIKIQTSKKTWVTWNVGECVGYSCVVPHRWAYKAIALDIVECVELPRQVFEIFLKKHDVYQKLVAWVKRLMFPNAFDPETTSYVHNLVDRTMVPLYPISDSSTVNMAEEGFLMKHLHYLETIKSSTPDRQQFQRRTADWKRVTNYLWLPSLNGNSSGDGDDKNVLEKLKRVGSVRKKGTA